MARKLAANVWVDGVLHKAGTSPDKSVADRITNPAAWGDSAADSDTGDEGEKPRRRTAKKSASSDDDS